MAACIRTADSDGLGNCDFPSSYDLSLREKPSLYHSNNFDYQTSTMIYSKLVLLAPFTSQVAFCRLEQNLTRFSYNIKTLMILLNEF